jgi:hypothetical protein
VLTGIGVALLVALAAALLVPSPSALAHRGAAALAWRNRGASLSLVAAFVLGTHGWVADAMAREQLQYVCVITLGYGHLLGGWVFARARLEALRPPGVSPLLFGALLAVSAASLLALYGEALARAPILLIPVLAVTTWHTIENDLALARAYGERLALGPVTRDRDYHLIALGVTGLVVAATLATMDPAALAFAIGGTPLDATGNLAPRIAVGLGGAWLVLGGSRPAHRVAGALLCAGAIALPADLRGTGIGFGEIFSIAVLHHLIGFLLLFADRARLALASGDRDAARSVGLRLALVHAPFALVTAALLLLPLPALYGLRTWFFSPALYLFWSLLHVAQTLAVRGLERASRPAAPASLWSDA